MNWVNLILLNKSMIDTLVGCTEIIDNGSSYLVAKVFRDREIRSCDLLVQTNKKRRKNCSKRCWWERNGTTMNIAIRGSGPAGDHPQVKWCMCDESFVPNHMPAGQQGGDTRMGNAGHHCHRAVFQLGKANDTEPTETHGDVNDLNSEPITLIPWLLTRIVQEQDLNSQGWKGKEHHGTSGLESAADLQISWYTSLMRWLITNY